MKKSNIAVSVFLGFAILLLMLVLQGNADAPENQVVYESPNLAITRLAAGTFVHTSYLQTKDWGKVPSNGMVVIDKNEAVVFDAPVSNESAEELIGYLTGKKVTVKAVIPTHFHEDCIGGLKAFHDHGIPSYAFEKTLEILKEKQPGAVMPQHGFHDKLTIKIGKEEATAVFLGEGHTKDNIVGYFPKDKVLFGGCMIREIGAGKGNTADANITEWSSTVARAEHRFPDAELVIPGHGKPGGKDLLKYTENLYKGETK